MDKLPCGTDVFLICVDEWSPGGCGGRYTSAGLGESGTFRDLARLLVWLDGCLDAQGRPQSFCASRRFTPLNSVGVWAEAAVRTRPGALATFHIRVRFRRNASWQGTVTWLERRRTMHFRSALELLGLMDGALSGRTLAETVPLRMEG